ncbi:alpha/beta hydrolase [Rhizobium mesoamericanum]|uniref:Uncharacterized protein n=1 Tax=Rhizobium mesoamericanum STM3625 TaxID=1211777 RepID=K0PQF8_9HYPH|nr:alpha/beta hydrolase [Rhizobium mesoamericanum]CCM76043.1 conserved hypothetical protein [Rhizobium mesoamericanum STM3625]
MFLNQLDEIGDIPRAFTIIASLHNRALGFSRQLAGGPRVGSGSDVAMKREIAVIDIFAIDGGRHTVFASSPTLMDFVNNNAQMRTCLERTGARAARPCLLTALQ